LASKFNTKNIKASTLPRLDLELKKEHYNVTEESDEFDLYSGVNFTYDLYTGGRNEAYKDQAIAEENASLNDRDALLQSLVAELRESVKNLSLAPDRLSAYKNSYLANKQSQFYAQEEFNTSSAVLLDLLQTERDFLDASESMLETLRASEIQKYSYLKLTGELGEIFEVILN
jgi:adhesin transport system outer membrane protein